MTTAQLEILADLQRDATNRAKATPQLDPLTQGDQEDEVTDWLEVHGVVDGWKLASALVGAGLDTEWLDDVVVNLPTESLSDVLTWLTETLTGSELLSEIEHGAARISDLVKAIKDYCIWIKPRCKRWTCMRA
jgi:hypothetical protein